MAEGSPRLDSPCVNSARPNLSGSHLLECSICLEQLRQPKCLPCLHSLCEECLSTYIVKETSVTGGTATSFTCPVCRKLTHAVDKSELKEKWAKQFPTDSHAVEMIQLANHTTEALYCIPCERKGNMMPAQFWCRTYKNAFCESCKVDHHDMVHIECDIVNMMTSNRSSLRQEPSTRRCDKHQEKMDCYCQDHKTLGCSKCIHVDHRKCEDVSTIEAYYEKLESTSRLDERKKSLQQGADAMDSLIKDFYLRLQSITDDKDAVLKSIDDLHERIDKCIVQMKKEITDDLLTAYKEEQEILKVSSQKCERLKSAIQNTLEASATALMNKDHMNTVLLYQRGQAEVESCKQLVTEMLKTCSSTKIEHEFDFNASNIGTVLSLGKVVTQKQQRNVPVGFNAFNKPLSRCELRDIRKVNIKCPSDTANCSPFGVIYLHDGRIVVGDHNNKKIKLINVAGDFVDELKLNGNPWDLCVVDNTTVAAAVTSPGGIRVVTVTPTKLSLSSVINTGKTCYGISHRDGGFVVSTGTEVCSVSEEGTTHKLHGCNDMVFGMSHDARHEQLFFAKHTQTAGMTAISRLSDDNKHTDVLEVGVVKSAVGVDVDVEGNVYVCGYSSNNVVQMSGDGTNVRVLLTAADGIGQPLAISVCGDKIVVTNGSSEEGNYIRVFQLV